MKIYVLFFIGLLVTSASAACTSTATTATACTSPQVCDLSLGTPACVAVTSCSTSVPYGDMTLLTCVASCPTATPVPLSTKQCAAVSASTVSLSTSAFATPPGKVFDGTLGSGADKATWGTYNRAIFGPGTVNTTVYAYGLTTTSTSIAAVASRTINATLLANGTADTTMGSVVGTDAAYTTAITTTGSWGAAVGLGSLGLAYVAADSTGCQQVNLAIFTGGTAAPATKALTSYACSHCTTATSGSTGVGYVNSISNVVYDNATYYVTWTSTKYTETADGTTTCSSSTTFPSSTTPTINKAQVFGYVQGVMAGALLWTTAPAFYTGTASANGAAPVPTAAGLAPMCGLSNYTNLTSTLYCTYNNKASPNVISYVPVTVSTGTAGTATSIATDVAAGSTYPTTAVTMTVAGFVHTQTIQGILLNNLTTVTATSTSTPTYTNTLQFYNLTSGATVTASGVAVGTSTNAIQNTVTGGSYGGVDGITYNGTGYAILDSYLSSSTSPGTYSFEWTSFNSSGGLNAAKSTPGTTTAGSTGNWFVDTKGALWLGAYTFDTAGYQVYVGSLGKVVSSTSSGNVLVSFFALLSVMVAALLAF